MSADTSSAVRGGGGALIPPNFEPTPEEKSLLTLYGTVRLYEKERDKIKEEAAKARLRAKDEQFRREQREAGNPIDDDDDHHHGNDDDNDHDYNNHNESDGDGEDHDRPVKKKAKKSRSSSMEDGTLIHNNNNDDDDENDDYDDDDQDSDTGPPNEHDDDYDDRARRRKEKLQKLRAEVMEEKGRAKIQNEIMEEQERNKHLGLHHSQDGMGGDIMMDIGLPTLKKKQPTSYRSTQESLLSSVEHSSTPPHEFSKKLAMPRASLSGRQIFPTSNETGAGAGAGASWSPPPTATGPKDGDLCIDLPEFDTHQLQSGNNTIAIKFFAPQESSRFSINITEPDNHDYADILFHFNPRQRQKGGQLVINDKQDGIWGQGINVPLSILPLIFGQTACTLILQINTEGFDVFLDGKHCARLEHRKQLPSQKCNLTLQMPSTDDYGSPENWKVYKIWWGHKKPMAGDLTDVPGVNVSSYLHPKKLFVSNLTKIYTEPEVELRRAELERAFRKYGGPQGCEVKVPTNSTFAFVEVETSRMADLALREMQNTYNISRARRTRQEVLQSQREAAGKTTEENTEWD